jgi:DNA-directed RNA polymerase specialized sigma24 family protein
MGQKNASSRGETEQRQSHLGIQAHLGGKLREMFEGPPEPLPQRLIELLEALAAKEKQHPQVNDTLKKSLLALIPNLRAFAFSLCGNHERADDLVQETLLKAWSHIGGFEEGTNLRAWLFTILRNCRRTPTHRTREKIRLVGRVKGTFVDI